jgi:hypothetical protein
MVGISPGVVVVVAEFGGGGAGLIVGISPARAQMESVKVNSADPQTCRSLVMDYSSRRQDWRLQEWSNTESVDRPELDLEGRILPPQLSRPLPRLTM